MSEKEIRQKAMIRYDQGERTKEIYTNYGKSERWFFKWLKRYKSGDPMKKKQYLLLSALSPPV